MTEQTLGASGRGTAAAARGSTGCQAPSAVSSAHVAVELIRRLMVTG